jgi:hypothetical protein
MPNYGYVNPFLARRQQNVFAPNPATPSRTRFGADLTPSNFDSGSVTTPGTPKKDDERYYDDISNMMSNVGPGIKAYRDFLTQMPNREDYQPGKWDRAAAALSGLAAGMRDPEKGVRVASSIRDAPYQEAMQDYAVKGSGLKERADMEQEELNSKLRALQNARALGLKYDEYDLKRREAQAKMDNDAAHVQIDQSRAETYAKSIGKKHYTGTPQQDGSVLWTNDQDPNDTHIGAGKSIASGQLGVSRTNAGANVQRANTSATAATETERHNRAMEKRPTALDRPQSPKDQSEAEGMALDELSLDPEFKDFIIPARSADDFPQPVEDDGSESYAAFLEMLNARKNAILQGKGNRRPTSRRK